MPSVKPPNWHLKKLQNATLRFGEQSTWFVSNVTKQRELTLSAIESHGESIDRFCDLVLEIVEDIKESILDHYCRDVDPKHPLLYELEHLIEQKKELAEAFIQNIEKDAAMSEIIDKAVKRNH